MSDFMPVIIMLGTVFCFAFPALLLTFGVLLVRAARRGEADAGAIRIGGWLVGVSVLSLVLYLVGAFSRQNALGWAGVSLVVLTAALCGWFLSRSSTRPLKVVSRVLIFSALFVAAFGAFSIWIAGEASRLSAYDNTNEAEVRAALAKNPDDAAAHSSLARIDERRNDHAGEMAEWRQVLRVEPDNVDALLLLGGRLTQQGRVNEARPLFQRLAARNDQFSVNARKWLARHGK